METSTSMRQIPHNCALCGGMVVGYPNHPHEVCAWCTEEAVTSEGKPVKFFETNKTFSAVVDGQQVNDNDAGHICFIKNTECWASVGSFGGIVVEVREWK